MKTEFDTLIEGYSELKAAYLQRFALIDACNDAVNDIENSPQFNFYLPSLKAVFREINVMESEFPLAMRFIESPTRDLGINFDHVIKGYSALKEIYTEEAGLIEKWASKSELTDETCEGYHRQYHVLEKRIKVLEKKFPIAMAFIKDPILIAEHLKLDIDQVIPGFSKLQSLYVSKAGLLARYHTARMGLIFLPDSHIDIETLLSLDIKILKLQAKYPVAYAFLDPHSEDRLAHHDLEAMMPGYMKVLEIRGVPDQALALKASYPIAYAYLHRGILFDPEFNPDTMSDTEEELLPHLYPFIQKSFIDAWGI